MSVEWYKGKDISQVVPEHDGSIKVWVDDPRYDRLYVVTAFRTDWGECVISEGWPSIPFPPKDDAYYLPIVVPERVTTPEEQEKAQMEERIRRSQSMFIMKEGYRE